MQAGHKNKELSRKVKIILIVSISVVVVLTLFFLISTSGAFSTNLKLRFFLASDCKNSDIVGEVYWGPVEEYTDISWQDNRLVINTTVSPNCDTMMVIADYQLAEGNEIHLETREIFKGDAACVCPRDANYTILGLDTMRKYEIYYEDRLLGKSD